MASIVNAIERLIGGLGVLIALLIVPLIIATCFEVFSRYLFGAPTIWAFELGYILTGAHFLLGAGLALLRGQHIRIDVLYAHFSKRTRAALDLLFYVALFLPFLVLVTNSLFDYTARAFASGERSGASAWNPPIWPFRALITLGFALLLLQVVAEILKCVATLRGRPIASEEEG